MTAQQLASAWSLEMCAQLVRMNLVPNQPVDVEIVSEMAGVKVRVIIKRLSPEMVRCLEEISRREEGKVPHDS